jgi:hypothetical protein
MRRIGQIAAFIVATYLCGYVVVRVDKITEETGSDRRASVPVRKDLSSLSLGRWRLRWSLLVPVFYFAGELRRAEASPLTMRWRRAGHRQRSNVRDPDAVYRDCHRRVSVPSGRTRRR